jgi:multiple sugar transport system substrate-binding protein
LKGRNLKIKLLELRMAAVAVGIAIPMVAVPAMATDIRMAIWSAAEAHLELFNQIAADYKAMQPDVNITFDSLPFDGYTTTLTTQIAGGNAPDLAWILETTAGDFVSSGRWRR